MTYSSKNEVKVPIVDFCKQDLKPGSAQWEATRKQVFEAIQEYGCFEAIYDKVPNEIREGLCDTLKQVLPLKDKLIEYSSKPYPIYEGQYPHDPMFYPIHHATLLLPAGIETFANTMWPADGNPHFCNMAKSYSKAVLELDEMVKRMILESLGLNHYIDEFLDISSFIDLRLTQYMKTAEGKESGKLEIDAHTDVSFLTIIKQEQVGLQLLSRDGKWIEFDVSPNSYAVLFSDSFMAWTNGRLKAAHHTVVKDNDIDRISIQMFSYPKLGRIVKPPKELVDDANPLIFKPYDVADYFEYYISGARDAGNWGLQRFIRL